ncbi:MAG: hypothetical protein JWN95_640 [Frankiales bacterium]|nr:hypothetical protein [Frankiales bacterium]
MSIVQTVLVFVGIPLGAFLLFAIVILAPSAVRAPRYRPGSPWQYKPVWYLPHPEHTQPVSSLQVAGAHEASARLAIHGTVASPVEASGGASGEW